MPLRADLRFTMKQTFAARTTTSVEYYKGNRWRSDSEPGGGYWIVDSVNRRTITVDRVKREYSVNTFGCVYFRTTAKYVQNDAVRLIRLGWANG